MRQIALLALAAPLMLAACSSSSKAEQPKAPTIQANIRTGSPGTTAPGESTAFGKAQILEHDGWKVTATIYSYRQPLPSEQPPSRHGFVYAGLDVRLCVDRIPEGQDGAVASDPWSLVYPDDTVTEPANVVREDFTVPLYPQSGRNVPAGECVRGWIAYEVARDKKPGRAVYAPTNPNGQPFRPLRWSIP